MHRLLSPGTQPEALVSAYDPQPGEESGPSPGHLGADPILSEAPMVILRELQGTLRENGIQAEPVEIVQAMLEALSARPTLCRGLLAAYLLDS